MKRCLALAAVLATLVAPAFAAGSGLRESLPAYLRSIALVLVEGSSGDGSGTAFAVETTPQGTLMVTAAHVVERARSVKVLVGDQDSYPATVVANDPDADLALLEVAGVSLPALPLAPGPVPTLGSDLAVVGYPMADRLYSAGMGLRASLSKGVLSAVRETPHGDVLQVDAAINPGNSGGPAFDWDTGQVVGVAMAQLRDSSSINFLVGLETLKKFLALRPMRQDAPAAGIEEALQKLELKYEVDEDGDFRLVYDVGEGRTQLVFISGKAEEYGSIQIREIWAPSFLTQGALPAEVANRLLLESQQAKIGGWQVMELGENRMAIYAIKVRDGVPAEELQEWLEYVMLRADVMEKDVTGKDEY